MLKRINKEQICCPVVFFEEIWGGKYPAGPRASCFIFVALYAQQISYFSLLFSLAGPVFSLFFTFLSQEIRSVGPDSNHG